MVLVSHVIDICCNRSLLLSVSFVINTFAIGKFVIGDDDTIYATAADYVNYDGSVVAIAIPEPSSVMLLLGGFVGMVFYRRRRRYFQR